jgi:hypothetical protein
MFEEQGLTDLNFIDEATIEVYRAEFANGSMWQFEGYFDPHPINPGQVKARPRGMT